MIYNICNYTNLLFIVISLNLYTYVVCSYIVILKVNFVKLKIKYRSYNVLALQIDCIYVLH